MRDLYQRLSQEGFIQPWLDEEELLPGQDWQREIPQAVRASDVVLVCLSSQSVTKAGYVQKEIKFALDVADEQPEGTIFLIPVRLEACDVPERLQRWHWANLFEARGYERLLRALKLRAEAPSHVIPSASEESSPPATTPSPASQETPPFGRSDMENESVIPSASEESSSPAARKPAEASTPPPPPDSPAKRQTPPFVRSDMESESVIPSASEESSSPTARKPAEASTLPPPPDSPAKRQTPPFGRSDMGTASVIPSASEESSPPVAQKPAEATNPSPAKRQTPHFGRSDMQPQSPISNLQSPSSITFTSPFPLELVRIPAGEFLMGSDPDIDKDAQPDEQPQHRVYVSEFYIGKYPVTNGQYAAYVTAKKYRGPKHWKKERIPPAKESHPVVYVFEGDAAGFCRWLSEETGQPFRLPTEAEWEKAARGTDGRVYPWGNEWDKTKLNSFGGRPSDTTPVGHYSPSGDSPYGAADMAGNVWEWCADWYGEKEYQRRAVGETRDPTGPKKRIFGDNFQVQRGGAFDQGALWARCTARYVPDYTFNVFHSFGFRVVLGGPLSFELLKR